MGLEYGTGICGTELADWNVGLEHHKQKLLTYVHCKNERVNVLGLSQLQLHYQTMQWNFVMNALILIVDGIWWQGL